MDLANILFAFTVFLFAIKAAANGSLDKKRLALDPMDQSVMTFVIKVSLARLLLNGCGLTVIFFLFRSFWSDRGILAAVILMFCLPGQFITPIYVWKRSRGSMTVLKGRKFCTTIDEQIVFSQLEYSESAVWSLFLASGYLKADSYRFNEEFGIEEYELSLTNKEVRITFEKMIRDWFGKSVKEYNGFIKALLRGNTKEMNAYMNRIALSTFSYFDTGNRPSGSEPERFYHGFVLGLMVELADRYVITSNRESGFGRYDVMLKPRKKEDDGIILEFKVYDPDDEESLEDTVKAALRQIEDKNYKSVLMAEGISEERIREYGFGFEGKKVLIG